MPVDWDALKGDLNNANYDLKNAVPHLRDAGDPMAEVLTIEPDLGHALARLGGLLG